MTTLSKLAEMFERPAKTARVTGLNVTCSLTPDGAEAIAALIRALDGQQYDGLTREQTQIVIRLMLEHTGLFTIIKLWLTLRLLRWASPPKEKDRG